MKILTLWTRWFSLWVVLFASFAYWKPEWFLPLKSWIVPGTALIMFGMGIMLRPQDFSRVVRKPKAVLCGVLGQFFIMPIVGLILAKEMGMPPSLGMGMIIVGCCPGGTASDVMTYLAKGDVPLSVTLTACSSILSVFLLHFLFGFTEVNIFP